MTDAIKHYEHELAAAANLIAAAADNPNTYLQDAAGYLLVTRDMVANASWPESAARTTAGAMQVVGNYAARSDNVELADRAFGYEGLAGKWRLYGIATVAGTLDRHPDWTTWAESDETQESTATNQAAKTAMLVVKSKIALADYAAAGATEAERQTALSRAIACKRAAHVTVDWRRNGGEKYTTPITFGETEKYKTALDSLFAENGLWQEVDSPDPSYPFNEVKNGNQLAAKAAMGKLTRRDRRRLQRTWPLQDLLYVDAMVRGEEIPPHSIGGNSPLRGNALLAAAAPRIFVDMGLARGDQLDVYLRAGKVREAVKAYMHMQKYAHAPKLLAGALVLAPPYVEELQTAQEAYERYRRDVSSKIIAVQAPGLAQTEASEGTEQALLQPDTTLVSPELNLPNEQVNGLFTALRQLRSAVEVDPGSKEAATALYRLRDNWDELEQMESYGESLPALAAVLKSQGIIFVKEWKSFSENGYIGYGLVAPAVQTKENGDKSFFARPYMVEWLRDAARKLNELHGEDRFVFTEHPETKPGEGDYAHETMQRIGIEGSWRQRGLRYWELVSAEGTASRIKGSLDTLPHVTSRLMALELADE